MLLDNQTLMLALTIGVGLLFLGIGWLILQIVLKLTMKVFFMGCGAIVVLGLLGAGLVVVLGQLG